MEFIEFLDSRFSVLYDLSLSVSLYLLSMVCNLVLNIRMDFILIIGDPENYFFVYKDRDPLYLGLELICIMLVYLFQFGFTRDIKNISSSLLSILTHIRLSIKLHKISKQ